MISQSKKRIIIFSIKNDPHVDKVINICESKGYKCIRLNSDSLKNEPSINIKTPTLDLLINYKNEIINSKDICSVWYRKPHLWSNKKISQLKGAQITYKYQEINSLFKQIMFHFEATDNLTIINKYSSLEKAGNKINQLYTAQKIGFKIPNTIISTDSKELINFLKVNDGIGIIKSLYKSHARYGNKELNYLTYRIDAKQINEYFSKYELDSPVLLQEEVEKLYELRITVVGESIYACKIDSQEFELSKTDWRKVNPLELKHEIIKLPKEIELLCKSLCKFYDLKFGAIDMAVKPNGDYIFFEINPNGQYLWIEEFTNAPISQTISKLLCI